MSALEISEDAGVLRLRLNRPDQFNALTGEMVVALVDRLHRATAEEAVRVVLVTGTGAAFSAGADLEGADPAAKYDAGSVDGAAVMVDAVIGCDKPVVCGLNGVAAGVGMSLALACDLVVATESAALTLAFARVGLMPDGGATATLAASVGRARAMRLALTSDMLSAAEAYDAGLVTHVFPDTEYADQLERILQRLASGPPLAFAATKRAINAATLDRLSEAHAQERRGQSVLLRTKDAGEGMRAFLEKRRPDFRGR
ncbi:enoyl-CoA hydratase [Nocardioides terrisoli]|uniref:enoyl-CoA hydratase n=1 Tax=Nocardioides terrisoli TaxID=3388267 RepID=UPI00287B8661|nr:enoyl-CoA hydratase [Nocardioides marmorisolisilvae]